MKRFKRQYFKPSIDGSWLSSDKSTILKNTKPNIDDAEAIKLANSSLFYESEIDLLNSNFNGTSNGVNSTNRKKNNGSGDSTKANIKRDNKIILDLMSNINGTSCNNLNTTNTGFYNNIEVSVTSLSLSLINLFDRIRETLCSLISKQNKCT